MGQDAKTAMKDIKRLLHKDSDYAWSWLCNLVMASHDEDMDLPAANRAAARFMLSTFDIDMTKHILFPSTQQVFK